MVHEIEIIATHTISKMASPTTLCKNNHVLLVNVQGKLLAKALIRQTSKSEGILTNSYGMIIDKMFKFGVI